MFTRSFLRRPSGPGTRIKGAATLGLLALLASMPSAVSASASAIPVAEIVNPENAKVFRPGDVPTVDGNAFAALGVNAVKLEFWLANRVERAVLATCSACNTATASYWTYKADGLVPGYYVVKAYAVDNNGKFSDPATRGFIYGLQTVQTPTPPATPLPSTPEMPSVPTITPPDGTLPGVGQPVVIAGKSGGADETIRVRETSLGPLGSATSDDKGNWRFETRLPNGTYRFRVRAIDEDGDSSKWSRVTRVEVDAQRPVLSILTEDDTVILPTAPIVIEGALNDEKGVAAVRVEYWLLDKVVLADWATCIGCSQRQLLWQHIPEGLQPGYYHVRVSAWDAAGNPSHNATTNFTYAV